MKISFLVHDDYAAGGLQRSTMAARDCLVAGGHAVEILCIRLEPGGLAERYGFIRPVTPPRPARLRFWTGLLRGLRRHFAENRPDLCIGMGLTPAIMLALAGIGARRPRLYGSERAFPGTVPTPRAWRWLRRFALPRLDGLICQTGRTAEYYLSAMGIDAARLVVIPNVIAPPPADPPPPAPALARFAGHPVIACVGRLEPQKGFDMALRVFAGIDSRAPEARFVIVGEGPCEAQYRTQAQSLGLAGKVLFLPRLASLAELWPAVDVFLLSSRYEGIPNVLGEAMAHGIACVAFDCPTGPAELVTNGEDGFLVETGDIAAATERCLALINDPALRRRLGDAARAVSIRFSQAEICRLWNALALRG